MTEAQAQWLRKLRDEGAQKHPNYATSGEWRDCFGALWADFDDHNIDFITPAGRAALAAHDAAILRAIKARGK